MSKRSKLSMFVIIAALVACHALAPQALSQCGPFSDTTGPSTHAGALSPVGSPSSCSNPPLTCPDIVDTGNQYQYDIQGFKNTSGSPQCYTVTITKTGAGCSSGLFGAAYLDDLDPSNLCTNYLADSGVSGITTSGAFEFNVATGHNFFVLIESFSTGETCDYTMSLSSTPTPCTAGTITDARVESFTAMGDGDGRVLLQWQTGFEVDNLGFNIYRAQGGKRVRVNTHMIAGSALLVGPGTPLRAGRSYAWWDESPPGTEDAQYWLEDSDLRVQSTWHGPASITRPAHPDRVPPAGLTQAALLSRLGRTVASQRPAVPVEQRAPRSTSTDASSQQQSLLAAQSPQQSPLAAQPAVKLAVRRAGWYRVAQPDLVAAGLDPRVNPRLLQLYVDGRAVPLRVTGEADGTFDAGDAIEFYGTGLDTPWTDTRTYWLAAGSHPGLRVNTLKQWSGRPAPTSFVSTVERQDRTVYFSSLRNGEQENFFGAVVAAEPVELDLQVPHPAKAPPGVPVLEVRLQGVTVVSHRVQVALNGVDVGEVVFAGQAAGTATLPLAPLLLRQGVNRVRLTAQAGPGDVSLVDTLRMTYWRRYTADRNLLWLTATGQQRVTINGFSRSDIRVMDITSPEAIQEVKGLVTAQGASFAVSFSVPQTGSRTLLAFTGEHVQRPAVVTANQPSQWRQPGQGADLVFISHRAFIRSLKPLKALRQSQGWRVVVVDVEDLYDEFSAGQKTPYAIQDFLRYATAWWEPAPRFVLFVGHASHDPKNYLGFGDSDFVPTKLIDTQRMETASDDWLADFAGDGLPELAVGRLPVRTAQGAARIVAKIVGYEQGSAGSGVLLVADRNEGFDFATATEQLRELLPAGVTVEAIDRGQMDDATARSQLLASLNRGPALVNYAGHGSVNLWRGNLLTADDARTLSNGEHLSVFVPMTCLNGYFHDPALESLAEALLHAQGGGAAVWAPSGMTEANGQAVMNQELYRLLFAESNPKGAALTLGEAALRAKAAVSNGDIRRTWILLGDPTMKLRVR